MLNSHCCKQLTQPRRTDFHSVINIRVENCDEMLMPRCKLHSPLQLPAIASRTTHLRAASRHSVAIIVVRYNERFRRPACMAAPTTHRPESSGRSLAPTIASLSPKSSLASDASPSNPDVLRSLYSVMLKTRLLEEQVLSLLRAGRIPGVSVPILGGEATEVGACIGLQPDDSFRHHAPQARHPRRQRHSAPAGFRPAIQLREGIPRRASVQ